MARITVNINDDVLAAGEVAYRKSLPNHAGRINRSAMVSWGLIELVRLGSRSEASGRGRTETLRALRATRASLDELEATLTQDKPVKRRTRRV